MLPKVQASFHGQIWDFRRQRIVMNILEIVLSVLLQWMWKFKFCDAMTPLNFEKKNGGAAQSSVPMNHMLI